MTLSLLVLTAGCVSGEIDTSPTTDTGVIDTLGDSGTPTTDSGASDSGPTDSGVTDSGLTETVDVPLLFSGGDTANLTAGTFPLLLSGDEFFVEDAVASTPAEDGATIAVPIPDTADLYEISDNAPGLLAMLYAGLAWEDLDADGSHDEGTEAIAGVVGEHSLIYLGGEVARYGITEGFYILYESVLGETVFADLSFGLDIAVYDPDRELTLAGTSANLPPAGDAAVALVPLTMLQGSPASPLEDGEPSEAWSFNVSGEPPSDHTVDITDERGRTLRLGYEVPLAYRDTDGSGSFDTSDAPLGVACEGANAAVGIFVYPPRYRDYAFYFSSSGLNLGWSALGAVTGSDDTEPVENPTALVIDPTACSL